MSQYEKPSRGSSPTNNRYRYCMIAIPEKTIQFSEVKASLEHPEFTYKYVVQTLFIQKTAYKSLTMSDPRSRSDDRSL